MTIVVHEFWNIGGKNVLTSPSKFESGLTSLIPNVLTTSDHSDRKDAMTTTLC